MNQSQSNLKLAERGALISIVAYLFLSAAKLATGHLLHSSSLVADGFNNLSDIISNVALLIGIRLARQPAEDVYKRQTRPSISSFTFSKPIKEFNSFDNISNDFVLVSFNIA